MRIKNFLCVGFLLAMTPLLLAAGLPINQGNKPSENLPFKVQISKLSYLEVQGVQIINWEEEQILTFRIRLQNNESVPREYMNYGFKLTTSSGLKITAKMVREEAETFRVEGHSVKEFTYYAKVSKKVRVNQLKFDFFEWNYRYTSFERKLSHLNIPVKESVIPYQEKLIISDKLGQYSIQVDRMYYFKHSQGITVSTKVWVSNLGRQGREEPEFSYWLRTITGDMYELVRKETDKRQFKAKEKGYLELYAELPAGTYSTDTLVLTTNLDKSDEKLPVYVLQLMAMEEFPVSATFEVPTSSNSYIQTSIESQVFTRPDITNSKNRILSTTLHINNPGKRNEKIPELAVIFESADRIQVTGKLEGTDKDQQLLPLETKILTINVTIPQDIQIENGKLILLESVDRNIDSIMLPVASFPIQMSKPDANKRIVSAQGDYKITVSRYYRLPWGEEDLVVADAVLHSLHNQAIEVPVLKSYYYIGNMKIESTVIPLDRLMTLNPGQGVKFQIVGRIPMMSSSLEGKLMIESQIGDETASVTAFDIATPSQVTLASSTYNLNLIGQKSSLSLGGLLVFPGSRLDTVVLQMIYENKERRSMAAQRWTGYLFNQDLVYPVDVINSEQRLGANRSLAFTIIGHLPKGTQLSNYELIIGLENSNQESETGGSVPVIVNPIRFKLPGEVPQKPSEFFVLPYKGSISGLTMANTPSQGLKLSFNAQLQTTIELDELDTEYGLSFEVYDLNGRILNMQSYQFDDSSNEYAIRLGEGKYEHQIFSYSSEVQSQYKVNVYLSYKQWKKLLFSQTLITGFNAGAY
ncbi:hypothetical protein [Cohnella sp. GCM10027633]|uniref:hypothetical protein n=1 Tax=unclassified Cohnella TaxID=2636738 RepID=UPI0036278B1B